MPLRDGVIGELAGEDEAAAMAEGWKKPRSQGERGRGEARGDEDLQPGVCRRRYAGVEASGGGVLRRILAAVR